jgi:hypothetical protein
MKQILLTQGKVALIDDDDFEYINQWKWRVAKCHNGAIYACRGTYNPNFSMILMHRVIMQTPGSLVVDHIDHNGLNNQKTNLRNCTDSENRCHSYRKSNNKTGFKGISWNQKNKRWYVEISVNHQRIYIGCFRVCADAVSAYDEAAKKYHGEFAQTNF